MKKSQLLLLFFVCLITSVAALPQATPPTPPQDRPSDRKPGERERHRGNDEGGFQELLRNATSGTVQSVTNDGMIVKKMDGSILTVKATKDTVFRRNREEAKLGDFKVGDYVIVAGEATGENTVTARFLAMRPRGENVMNPEDLGKKFILGEITKIEETKLTIRRPDGVEQVIEVDDDTSFKNSKRESITLADVKLGDRVMGRGDLKNGTFVPATLMVGLPQGAFGARRQHQEGAVKDAVPPAPGAQNNSVPK